MRKTSAILGSALFFVLAPCLAAGVIPWWISHWHVRPSLWDTGLTRTLGVPLIMAGVAGVVDSFARFALQGRGTPAPIAPPHHLVVSGLYRYVRNPMYVSVLAAIVGQALVLADWHLAAYAVLFWLACHAFVLLYEEPTLRRTFGAQFDDFCANVPRWIPRPRPWQATGPRHNEC
jgi:protein-S-isoprenylcysteine O-methyltransferase Ste14